MFGLFKKEETAVVEKHIVFANKVTSLDIQNDMFAELGIVLNKDFSPASASIEKLKKNNEEVIEKANLLRKFSFSNVPTAKNVEELESVIDAKDKQIQLEQQEIELTNKYRVEFPMYKFVPERIFKKVAEKYDLYTSKPDRYIKEIPVKNLNEINSFMEKYGSLYEVWYRSDWRWEEIIHDTYSSKKEADEFVNSRKGWDSSFQVREIPGIEITAPISHFNLENSEIKDRVISTIVEDPIVSRPVEGGRIVISVWDKEAEIPEIRNDEWN